MKLILWWYKEKFVTIFCFCLNIVRINTITNPRRKEKKNKFIYFLITKPKHWMKIVYYFITLYLLWWHIHAFRTNVLVKISFNDTIYMSSILIKHQKQIFCFSFSNIWESTRINNKGWLLITVGSGDFEWNRASKTKYDILLTYQS